MLAAYLELAKPRITFLVALTAAFGYYLGSVGQVQEMAALLEFLAGTALVAGGAGVLNHLLERDVDRRMHRTRDRPLPAGRVGASSALSFGICLVLAGLAILLLTANLLTAFLALLSAFLYVVVYTPMKRMTWLNTSFGAIPGALPPMGGWVAATGQVDAGAWALFAILFAWQHPHFFAIAWLFRDDYGRGGFKMLPVVEPDGRSTCRQIIGFSVLLIPLSVLPTLLGLSGMVYMVGAILLGLGMLGAAILLTISRSNLDARRLLKASVIYLPLLLILSVADLSI